jgi:hypothetical protein
MLYLVASVTAVDSHFSLFFSISDNPVFLTINIQSITGDQDFTLGLRLYTKDVDAPASIFKALVHQIVFSTFGISVITIFLIIQKYTHLLSSEQRKVLSDLAIILESINLDRLFTTFFPSSKSAGKLEIPSCIEDLSLILIFQV